MDVTHKDAAGSNAKRHGKADQIHQRVITKLHRRLGGLAVMSIMPGIVNFSQSLCHSGGMKGSKSFVHDSPLLRRIFLREKMLEVQAAHVAPVGTHVVGHVATVTAIEKDDAI